MAKPFLTYQQQIEKLQNEKGLIIADMQYAEMMLRRNSYFALITGYKHLFKNKTTGNYKDGTTFEDIVALYLFDKGLRELFLKYLCQVERHIRSLISYCFSEKFGENQNEYLDVNHYRYSGKNIPEINKLVSVLGKPIGDPKCQYEYIKHYVAKNHNVPLWVLLNTVTFGTLSKMYMLLTQDLQIKVSKNFPSVNESQMGKILSVLSKYRNVCAHNERLFSHRVNESIPDMLLHKKLGIPQKGVQYVQGKSDLFAVVIAMRYLLPADDFLNLKRELVKNLRDLIKFIPSHTVRYTTNFADEILSMEWNESELENDDLKNYKAKAEFYVRRHQNEEVIAKLRSNIPLNRDDIAALEKILWSEVGTREDYEAEIGSKPLGEFVREIIGLDMKAAKEAFAAYLNDATLDSRQIYFVNQIVEYIVHNGVMKDLSVLQEPPFTDKGSVVEIFTDLSVWMGIRKVIDQVNANAVA